MATIAETFDLSGRVAIVTGAGRGIGRQTASRLAEAGAMVVCADLNTDNAQETVGAITDAGRLATGRGVDVSQKGDVDALVANTVSAHGRLDIMVNNAGIITDGVLLETSEADFQRVHAVNFMGVVFGCQAAGRVMVEQRSGSIINLASGAIDMATPGIIPYATAKAAVAQLSRSFAVEVAPFGVRVNAVAPGWIDTPMNERHVLTDDGSIDAERKAAYVEQRKGLSPMGIAGEPDDIALAILYLASDAAKFWTGNIMRPNGGSTMPQ
jgi:3-oxoacyl-[acyl-carrier protein] reductase